MTAAELDLDAIKARANAATPGPWHPHTTYPHTVWQGSMYDEDPGMISTTLAHEIVADAVFIAAARTDVPALVAEVRRYQPATQGRYQIFIHTCGHVEPWDESTHGPINEQGCDACESAPDGGWRPVYVREVPR